MRHGDGHKKLWLNEYGWNTADEQTKAANLRMAFALAHELGRRGATAVAPRVLTSSGIGRSPRRTEMRSRSRSSEVPRASAGRLQCDDVMLQGE